MCLFKTMGFKVVFMLKNTSSEIFIAFIKKAKCNFWILIGGRDKFTLAERKEFLGDLPRNILINFPQQQLLLI